MKVWLLILLLASLNLVAKPDDSSNCLENDVYHKVTKGEFPSTVVKDCQHFLYTADHEAKDKIIVWLVRLGRIDLIKSLLEIGYRLPKTNQHYDLLNEAVIARESPHLMFEFLTENGLKTEESNKHKLYFNALETGNSDLIKVVEQSIGDLTVVFDSNNLFASVMANDLSNVKRLLINGADPNVEDKEGNTPLMAAVANEKDEEIIKLLTSFGASGEKLNKHGHSANTFVEEHNKYGIFPSKFTCEESITIKLPEKHPVGFAIRTPKEKWVYVVHNDLEDVQHIKNFNSQNTFLINPKKLKALIIGCGSRKEGLVFNEKGKYLFYFADNLMTEPENTYSLQYEVEYLGCED
ncbi:MAG: ankyrin repeat domain-containing protein [Gammaproteobacteria bacterium]|nr:ankyrin repeat domain-containing protein [Gammaproteobacteria bacterium]